MAVVNDQNAQRDSSGSEIILHELPPPFLFGLGDLGEAVTGQIHQVAGIVHQEVVHMDGFARLVPYPSKILSLKKPVDDR